MTPSADVRAVADATHLLAMSRTPFDASLVGVAGFDAAVPDVSVAGEERLRAELDRVDAEAARIDESGLDRQDAITLRMVRQELADQRTELDFPWAEIAVDATFRGPQAAVLSLVPKLPLDSGAAVDAYVARCAALPGFFAASAQRLRDGVAAGRTPPARSCRAAIAQLDEYASAAADPLAREGDAPDDAARQRIADAVATHVRPALAEYREVLAGLLPSCRPDERCGVVHVPGGADAYTAALRRHTTTDRTPEEVHELGLELVASLRAEVTELAGDPDPAAVFARLQNDPDGRFGSVEEMMTFNETALRRAEAELPRVLATPYRSPCAVSAMDPIESANSTIGYYQPPRITDGGGAAYWLNVADPASCPRFEYEALTFHEAVPGHHSQCAVAAELTGLPDLRRAGYVVAYSEGWALYTERLADELGLYTSTESRLGMLSFQLWRACRLVVDTGMHHHGWGRDRAVRYMRDNTGLTHRNIDNEVDRYIAWPGQACGYMLGCQEILRLRAGARDALGDRFDLRGFHDTVLRSGPLPLSVLGEVVDAWVRGA